MDPFRFSRDGRSLIFVTREALPPERTGRIDTNGVSDVFHYDLGSDVLKLVSGGVVGRLGNGAASQPQISGDGRRIVFRSEASNLVDGDANGQADVFLYEVGTGRTTLLSGRPSSGQPGAGLSTIPAISDDGRFVTFVSTVPDLVPGDGNDRPDVFGLSLEATVAGDTDRDGLADAWELTHFGNLNQTADGDADEDGRNNLNEFIAGTNPTSSASVFRISVSHPSAAEITLTWQSQLEVSYVVETAPSLSAAGFAAWGSPIPGDGSLKSVTLAGTGLTGFVRVRVQR